MIAGGARGEVLGQIFGHRLELYAHGVAKGCGTEHNVTFDITAGAQGGYQHRVEGLERRFDIAFEHAMQLNTLARGQANIAFAHLIAQGVVNKILLGSKAATRQLAAHHKIVRAIVAPAYIAIVLLVDAMKLEQFGHIFTKAGRRFG